MKGKFLFTAALAALTVSCSQEELETPRAEVENRIAIETPVVAFGNDTQTRMTTEGNAAAVKWQENDGFGAMLVDQVKDLTSEEWGGRYTITPTVKHSNFLFRYNSTTGTFNTDAAMVEGNYVFYAPFNENEKTRNSLLIKTPTVQNVTPGVVNSAVTEFYEAAEYPVFLAYKALKADDPEKTISIDMKHIFATPLITLNNQYTTGAGTPEDPVVYHDLNVYKVEFTLSGGAKFMQEAYINNTNVINAIKEKGAWATAEHEDAATSDLYTSTKATTDKITINFGEGLTITQKQKAQFAVILPAEDYEQDLQATVYVKVDGSEKKFAGFFIPARELCLNPGFPYPAQEYNADGSLKATKGTSATYTLAGTLVDASAPAVVADGIENEQQLIDYINNVAYRGEDITQVTGSVTDPGLEFKIKDGSVVTLTDAFLDAVQNSLIVNGEGTVTFVDNSKIRLGAISKDRTLGGKITYPAGIQVAGNYTVQDGDIITVESGTVTVPAGIKYTITNNGGTLNVAGAPDVESTINNNNAGVVNINGDTDANLTINNNGKATDPKQTSVIKIAAGKTVKSTINNSAYGKINNSGLLYGATGYAITNSGLIEVTDINAGIDIDGNGGKICNNVQCPYVTVTGTKTVYCDLTSVPASIADNINTVNLSGSITFAENVFAGGKVFANVTTVNVANGTVIISGSMTGTGVVTFKFPEGVNEKAFWNSVHAMQAVSVSGFYKTGNVEKGTNVTLTWL